MKFKKLKIDILVPSSYNPRKKLKPGDAEFEKIKNSITEFGYADPIIVNSDMTIIGGHQRWSVLKSLGYTEVDCIVIEIDKTKEKALNIALNKVTGEWDKNLLADLIKDLQAADFDVSFTGFDPPEIDELFNQVHSKETKEDDCDIPLPETPISRTGDLWLLGRHRLACGDSTDPAVFDTLLEGKKVNLVVTDPPYNVNYESNAGSIKNDNMTDKNFYSFLLAAFKNMYNSMADDASIYVFHADTEGLNFRKAFINAGLYLSGVCVWAKNSLVLGRSPYQWKHEPCQPAGTMVLTTDGEKPIEDLQDGDCVISYNSYNGQIVGYRNGGCTIKTAQRHYDGLMYSITVAGKATKATNNHKFSVRYNPDTRSTYCTYLMRRGNWWRVGYTRTYNSRGFGLKERMRNEKADEVWLLRVYSDASSARADEQLFSTKFGIPQTYWEIPTGTKCIDFRSTDDIEYIYNNLDKDKLQSGAEALLSFCGREVAYPLITRENRNEKMSARATSKVCACNLVEGIMQLPIPKNYSNNKNFSWEPISNVSSTPFAGFVYSLAVKQYEHYIADGIVTHNCLFGWKKDGKHKWFADRKQSTIWNFDRPTKSDLHPTMKPIALCAYPILNSSMTNGLVLDPFAGSFSTGIACEQTGRNFYGIEIDTKYVDVCITRYINQVGNSDNVFVIRDGVKISYAEVQNEAS